MFRYLINFIIASMLAVLAMSLFIWCIDPYKIYKKPDINANEQISIMSERVFKTVALANVEAEIVFIGTSRVNVGIERKLPYFKDKQVINLATAGQTIHETRELIEHVINNKPPKVIILGLDFFAFNASEKNTSDFVEENFESQRKFKLLFSISALLDSWRSYRGKGYSIYPDGFYETSPLNFANGQYDNKFIRSQKAFMLDRYNVNSNCQFSYKSSNGVNSFDELRKIVEIAHKHDIELKIFMSPPHARLWETMASIGLYKTWEDWKKSVIKLNQQVALDLNSTPYIIWDFSGYDQFSTEAVPVDGDTKNVMNFYLDVSHYMPVVGREILKRIYGQSDLSWGVKLSPENIEHHLAKIRSDRERYRSTHIRDISETENMVTLTMRQYGWCLNLRNNK